MMVLNKLTGVNRPNDRRERGTFFGELQDIRKIGTYRGSWGKVGKEISGIEKNLMR